MGKQGQNLFLDCDSDKCVGCGICEYACSYGREGVFSPLRSRIQVVKIGLHINMAITCRKCEDPPCVSSCPKKALIQRQDGLIVVDEEKCNGCGWCVEACDFGAISIHPENKTALICDLCGACECLGGPQCIQWCPEGALYLTDKRLLPQKARINAVRKLLKE
ncbi:MAG: 4Fe-4S dicluster domain-containing protein [Candidatus Bathycorpusculaceae bacterium]